MNGLGAALIVVLIILAIVVVLAITLGPVIEKVAYYSYQKQLSKERISAGNNLTQVMVFGLIVLATVCVVGVVFFFREQEQTRQHQLRLIEERRHYIEAARYYQAWEVHGSTELVDARQVSRHST